MGRPIRSFAPNDSAIPAALLALSLAACGPATVPSPIAPASQGAATAVAASPQQRAKADATWILASFVPPPGSRRLSHAPAGVHDALNEPVSTPGTPDLVDDSSLWQVPGPSYGVLGYERAHLPARFQFQGGGTATGTSGHQVSFDDFAVQSGLGPLEAAELQVDSITSTSGQTYVRVDAQVTWQPTRPAATFLPAGKIHAVVVSAVPGGNDPKKPPAPVTVTDPVKVRQLVSLVNGLPLFPPGAYSCLADDGRGVRMEFLGAPGGTRLATAFAKANGCGGTLLLIGAGKLTDTGGATGGEIALGPIASDQAQQVLTISGMHWKLYGYG